MKKYLKFVIVSLFVIPILLLNFAPALAATSSFTKVQSGFTVDPSQPGILLKPGSTIHHLSTGITEVYGPDNALKLKALDSESARIITPYGPKNASDVYSVPDGAKINYGSKITRIFDNNNKLLLKIIYDKQNQNTIIPNTHAWLAQSYDTDLNIDYFTAYWNVPDPPPNSNDCDFYWDGIQNPSGSTLLQPVLQWNQGGAPNVWSIQAWALWPNGGVSKGGITKVNQGATVGGRLQIVGDYWWVLVNVNGGGWNGIMISTNILGTQNITALNVLEVYRTDNNSFVNDDLPGCGWFSNETLQDNGNNIPISWQESDPGQTEYNLSLGVFYDSTGTWVSFITPN